MDALAAVAKIAATHEGLQLLVLHGSRARGEAREGSDWDFAYQADRGTDISALHGSLITALGTDRVDLADLESASGVLRFRAARDGRAVFERNPGAFARFCTEAARFWHDMEPVLTKAYDRLLGDLDR